MGAENSSVFRNVLARLLVDARADVEARDSGGSTAVHRSIYLNYKGYTFDAAAFKVLVTAGANLDARDDEGYTVLDWVLDDCYLTDVPCARSRPCSHAGAAPSSRCASPSSCAYWRCIAARSSACLPRRHPISRAL